MQRSDSRFRLGALTLIGAFLLVVAWRSPVGAQAPASKVEPALAAALAQGPADFLVVLAQQADLSGAAALPDRVAKGVWVVEQLRATAEREQAPLRAFLDRQGVSYRPFWVLNALLVRGGDANLARLLVERPEVARLVANPETRARLPEPDPDRPSAQAAADTIEWHVERVRAPDVWETYGVRGEGVVVAIKDTGVRWDHEALKAQYRGWDSASGNVDHDYNWHDAFDQYGAPHDDHGHGTHVTGIVVGDNQPGALPVDPKRLYFPVVSYTPPGVDGADGAAAGEAAEETRRQIGVAPSARWIACRNMSGGFGTPSSYLDCFEWLLAPTPIEGGAGRPELAPDIINNSWACTPSEGCTDDQIDVLRDVVVAVRSAGILNVAAAGNYGHGVCGTITDPPTIYPELFSVGATTSAPGNSLASFSSIGPVLRDGSGRFKPDLVAPGAAVFSSHAALPNAYLTRSGTSMATPGVSGVAALMLSAAPQLSGDVELIERILRETAAPITETRTIGHPDGACLADGSTHPNLLYGWGLVDALAAVEVARSCPTADFDGDGVVTERDLALQAAAANRPLTRGFDLTADGRIDAADIQLAAEQLGTGCNFNRER